ncbi:ATP-binding cassette family protein [Pontibacter diazotrophicus]|uniref:ATP-binding cassette family protein n=1 Tax=Pontibacter diazotrophicus TaxID=1400979 RepID=A0A3D8LEX9_9BACT|nr:AAA family ATPase [Pontibacter diazotrophicus]RDV16009.1 ATP-binding cassette family protein [Pontibacter diazotrophicus]
MKILSVRFQNLNSLKGEHEIRFDQSPLADAGLFAITGQTGAGKTTILDAITVGLYGLVHRHSSDKPLELMTRHTAESFSEVEFEANGQRYRSRWQIRRSRGKADGNMQPVHMELCDLEDDKPFDLKPSQVPDKVAEICGLDYNQFLRSVMLSQGDFARFLKANPNERSNLLEKITDTGIYSEISKSAYEKAKAERQKREELERRLQDSKLLPEEQRQAYEQSVAELKEQEAVFQKEINLVQEQLQWLQQVQQLQSKKQQHEAALQVQEQKLEQLQPDFRKLQQHEQANQYVGELTEIKAADNKVIEVQEQLQTLEKQLPVLEAELELAGKVATEAGKAYQQQEEILQKLEPLLEQVTKLDHQLHAARDNYAKDKSIYQQFEAALKQEQALLPEKQQELEKLTQEATTLKGWLETNQHLQDLRENLPEFRQTLKDLQEVEQKLKFNQKEQQELQNQRVQEAQQVRQLIQAQEQQQAQQKELEKQKKEKLTQLQEILSDKSMEELEQAAQAQPAVLARYERLAEFAQQHAALQQKLKSLENQIAQQEQEAASHKTKLAETQRNYTAAAERLEDLQKLVVLQQRIQEYEQARHTLKPEEPCPLCGSEHHPFVEGAYTISLTEEEQKRDRQQALVTEIQRSIHTLQLQISALQPKLQLAAQAKAEAASEKERLQLSFTQLAEGVALDLTIEEDAKLSELLQNEKQALDQLHKTLAQARNLSRETEAVNQQLMQLREAQVQAQGKYAQLQHSDKLLQTQLQKLQVTLQDQQEQQQAHTETAESFAATYRLAYKPEARQELLQTLEQQAAAHQQKQQALEQMREKYIELKEQVKALQTKVQEKEQELKERQENLKLEHVKLTELKETRTQLFGEKAPQQERQLAQQELRHLANQAEEARAKQQKKQQQLQEARQRRTECTSKHQQNKSVLDRLRDGLLQVLQQKGIATIEALSQMLLERDEADRLANLKSQTEKYLTELRKSLSDVRHDLEVTQAKQLTSESTDALQKTSEEKKQQQRELIEQRARYQQLLEQDAAQRAKNKELAEQLQTQQLVCNRWDQLADLIGSADGNKFSRFAQGLTLARLVELANRHLQKLNDRYRILKSSDEDLELLIVDTYQAEAIRPMNTLSGGESFLVSLALALGLSDLAGRRTQINSLFIDEGFGTLDAETLDAAISTLENLQAGGKMIGIISHVEALKERISTQIRVQKKAGGVSKVEIVGW